MPLSWNEIKHRAIAFSKEWKDETREEPEAPISPATANPPPSPSGRGPG